MPAPTGLSPLLHSAGIALGLLLVAALLTHREGNRVANRWLAAFVACLALLWLNDLLEETDIWLRFTWTQNAFDWLLLVFGPCLWIYVRRLTLHDKPRGWALLPHAIPALLLIALLMQVYLAPEEQKRALTLADRAQRATRGPDWILFACALQVMAYWIASLRVLQRFGVRLKENHSSVGERSFDLAAHAADGDPRGVDRLGHRHPAAFAVGRRAGQHCHPGVPLRARVLRPAPARGVRRAPFRGSARGQAPLRALGPG